MTNREKQAVKEWNIAIGKEEEDRRVKYRALRDKYFALNGSVSCSYSDFLIEVCTCDKVDDCERTRDLYSIIQYHESVGKMEALLELIRVL